MKNSKLYDKEYYMEIEKSGPFREEFEGDKNNRRNVALTLFKKIGAKKILDAGCGPGFDALFFMKHGFDVYACDISKKVIKYAKNKNPGPKYFVWNIEEKPIKMKFDGIYAFEVIEHIFDYDIFLTNLNKSLNEEGLLILSTPNILAPRNRLNILIGKDVWFETKYHIHFFSPRILKISLERNGFEVIKIIGSGKISFLGPNFSGSIISIAKKICNI
jgi:2-polyprenyl-3-methyl-5-hydroxy-6-metoxy-1,4-benzoquinol methylase